MLQYMCKRLLRSLVTLLIIVVVIFSLLRLMPEEGYFDNYDKLTPSEIENKLTLMGLRDPLPKQLFKFMGGLLRGDLGVSNRYRRNAAITDILGPKIIVSLKFGLSAVAISLPLGMLLGIFMSRKRAALGINSGISSLCLFRPCQAPSIICSFSYTARGR